MAGDTLIGAPQAHRSGSRIIGPTALTAAAGASLWIWPALAEVQHPDFFTSYALQSGQHYWTRPPWKVAGVDYPVGAPSSGLRDPLGAGALPAGCRYLPARNWVFCGPPAADLTLDRLDFSLHGCVQLVIDPRLAGTVTVSNSRFADGPGCETGPGSSLVSTSGAGSADLVFVHNDVDGNAGILETWPACQPVTKCMTHDVAWRTTGSVTIENNAFLNTAARAVEAEVGVSAVYRGNYAQGIWGNTAHGEFQLTNTRPGASASFEFADNTMLQPARVPYPAVTAWDPVTEFGTARFSTITKSRNVLIANKPTFLGKRASIAWIDETATGSADTLVRSENYYDPSGAFGCINPGLAKIVTIITKGDVNLIAPNDPHLETGSCTGAVH